MRWESVYLAGLGTWLPRPVPVRDAVDAGVIGPEWIDDYGYESVLVAEDVAPPDMAVEAAQTAVKRSGAAPEDFSLILHGSTWFQGLDIWPAASYIAGRTIGDNVPGFDVQQRCSVGVSALELAAGQLATGVRPGHAALVTTADRFGPAGVTRWTLRPGVAYADGATATVLSTRGGFARLLSTSTIADNTLEGLARGSEPFTAVSTAAGRTILLEERAEQYRKAHDESEISLRQARAMFKVKLEALSHAGVEMDDISYVIIPGTGRAKGEFQLHDVLGVPEERTTWAFAKRTGHVGTGDYCAALEHLVVTGAVGEGDRVMLYGIGAGFTCSAAVVELLEAPGW